MDNLLVEVRFSADPTRESPGRLTGTLLTYSERAADRPELFLPGALKWPADGVNINVQHQRGSPIVRVHPFVEGRAVKVDAMLPNTTAGRDAAANVREGVLTGLSVEIDRPSVEARYVNGLREVRSAHLSGIGLVDLASYRGSTVSVRQHQGNGWGYAVWL